VRARVAARYLKRHFQRTELLQHLCHGGVHGVDGRAVFVGLHLCSLKPAVRAGPALVSVGHARGMTR
jgi:hypothetical protein